MTSKIMIVDNHFIIREGLKLIFESNEHFDITYEASDGEEAIKILEVEKPDLILLDIKMAKIDGFGVMKYLQDNQPLVPVVVLSTVDSANQIRQMLRLGAKGYLLKDASTETIFNTVRNAVQGNVILQSQISNIVFDQERATQEEVTPYGLSNTEINILCYLAKGLKIREIALQQYLSERTVKNHLTSVYTKMNVSTGVEAVALGVKRNIIKI
ncbi:DNA-binding response regulator [Leuconostoc litchii]|uniref:Response regulator transcription factor n=1 Tax=Leuconostoc litchii TaxID=1981069 RepID=A0A6P2CND9_9LACO|nr:response regulator transcription factor [Leuconostoc litchii]TYC47094.1 response regulator transcription factor [Leuconostoc litchii]GMA69036.1 DNA-binding response regulator [Leuconostoc litchii]